MPKDYFHGLLDKFDSLRVELVEYEHKVENMCLENLQLRSRLAESGQQHNFSYVGETPAIPGGVPHASHESESSDIGCCCTWDLDIVPTSNPLTIAAQELTKIDSNKSVNRKASGGSNHAPRHRFLDLKPHRRKSKSANAADDSKMQNSAALSMFDETAVKQLKGVKQDAVVGKITDEYDLAGKAGVRGMMMRRSSIVQMPQKLNNISETRRHVLNLISLSAFDAVIGAVIVANAITIGIETSYGVKGKNPPMVIFALEVFFLCVYMVELGLRLYAIGLQQSLKFPWIRFDAFLVFAGLIDFTIKAILAGRSAEVLDKIMLIRMLRLMRLARTVRLMIQFRTLWLLVQGLMHSLLTLLWTLVVIVLLCYCFSILGLELIRTTPKYGPEYQETVDQYFSGLGDAMITHLQLLTLDDIGVVFRPLIRQRPELSIYFVSFIMLVSIALMNLVTAIMVESSLRQAKEDQAAHKAWENQKKKALVPKLRAMFQEMDEDGSGLLDMHELRGASDEIKSQLQRICNMEDVEEIFKSLDYDESGAVDIDEFCEGMLKATSDRPGELIRILKQCTEILQNTRECMEILSKRPTSPSSQSSPPLAIVSLEGEQTHTA